ncbi:hypothetical protein EHS25_006168 [Saitozyma podzolica]|uniref:NADP-dependent oxidoreductase domain-containing protein n=1 Tax=Saitozyma podzolica TaxID=1890683 RepID=A0A427XRS7_9TREE|nr:hypothetical protein EHS25_006168 [Saitozyma podzolica]
MSMPQVTLAGKSVGRIGYGLMQLTWNPKPPAEEVSFAAMKAAADAGATAWSTAMFYGPPTDQSANVRLIGNFFKKYPEYKDKITIVLKGGHDENMHPVSKNIVEFVRGEIRKAESLLGGKKVDVFSFARIPPGVEPEELFTALKQCRDEGLFAAVGASETGVETLEKVQKIVDIAVLEIEVSLWSYEKDIQDAIAWSAKNKVPIYAYSPLGRGFITRTYKSPEDIPEGSFQKGLPRFQGEAFYENLKLVDRLDEMAEAKGVSTAQLALAWILTLSPYTIPIPGSSSPSRVQGNCDAANVKFTDEEIGKINQILSTFELKGDRYMAGLHSLSMR